MRKYLLFSLFICTIVIKAQNYSLSFNGTSDYVSIPASPAWAFNTGDFTIEWWQYETDNNLYPRIFAMVTESNSTIAVSIESGKIYCWFGGTNCSATLATYKNTWVHLAYTRSGSTVSIYQNGNLLTSSPAANSYNINNTINALYLGKETAGYTYFGGQLDEFRIWNISRTKAQIQTNMNSELLGNETGLVAYYKMSNSSGTILSDNTISGGHDGTIYGALWVGNDNPLPVELSSFSSVVTGGSVLLKWETKTERNSFRFEIENSMTEGNMWESINSVQAAGLSNSPKLYSFTEKNVRAGKYLYRLKMIDNDGTFEYSNVIKVNIPLPQVFELGQNYPNPFNPSTKINYSLPTDSKVTLEVYNITGEKIGLIVNEEQSSGYYTVDFSASSLHKNLSSGVYLYRISAVDNVSGINITAIKKMIVLK